MLTGRAEQSPEVSGVKNMQLYLNFFEEKSSVLNVHNSAFMYNVHCTSFVCTNCNDALLKTDCMVWSGAQCW